MATITSKKVVDELIDMLKAEERFEIHSHVYAIVEYKKESGLVVWGITWNHDPERQRFMNHQPPYINHPKVIWCKDKELV
jgi:hypothetical protein